MKLMKYPCLSALIFLFALTSCISTQKYNLLVQSAQKSQIEKQQFADSVKYFKNLLATTKSQKDSIISLKNKILDSLNGKYAVLQVSYIDLEKNVFEKNQDFQANTKSYLSQIAQRDSLLRQIITQSKSLAAENQKLTADIEKLQKGVLSASYAPSKDTLHLDMTDSLYAKLVYQMKNFIGQEVGIAKQASKIQIQLAHQLLFQEDKLSEDGSFMLSQIAKILKSEKNTTIEMMNYANQEMAEKDRWEIGMMQFVSVAKVFDENGIKKEQISQLKVVSSPRENEVGVAIQRLEIWVGWRNE
jgi:hypothetical protein